MSRRYQGTTRTTTSNHKSSLSVSALLQTPWIEPLVYDTLIQHHHQHHSRHLHEDQHAHEDEEEEQQQQSPKIVQVLAINKIKMNLNHHDNNDNNDNTTFIDVPYTIHITDGTTSIIAYISDTVHQQQDDVHDGEDRRIQHPITGTTTSTTHMNRFYLNDILPGAFIRIENWEIIISYYNNTTTSCSNNNTNETYNNNENLYTNQLFQTYATIHEKNIIIPSFTSLFQSITTTTTTTTTTTVSTTTTPTTGEEGEGDGVGEVGEDSDNHRDTNTMNTNSEDNSQQPQQRTTNNSNTNSNGSTKNNSNHKIRAIYIQLNQPYLVIGNCSTILNHHHQHHNSNIVPVIDAIDVRRAIRSIEQQQEQQHEKSSKSKSTRTTTRISRTNTNNIMDHRRRIPTTNSNTSNNKTTTTTTIVPTSNNTNTNISIGNIQKLFDSTNDNNNVYNNSHEEQFWSYISSIPNNDSNNDNENTTSTNSATTTNNNNNRNIQQLLDSNDRDRSTHQNDFWSYISSIPNNTSNNNYGGNNNNNNDSTILGDDNVMETTDSQSQISTTKDDNITPTTTKPLSPYEVMISDTTNALHNELPIVQLNEQQYEEQEMNVSNNTNEITIHNNIIMNHDKDDTLANNNNKNKYGDNEISNVIVNIDDDDEEEQIGMSEMLIDDEGSDDCNDDGDDDEDVVEVEGGGNDIDESNNNNDIEEHVSEAPEQHVSDTPELLLPVPESSNNAMDDDDGDTTTKDLVNTDISTQPTGTVLPYTFDVGSQSNNLNNNHDSNNDETDNKDNDEGKNGMDQRHNELPDDEGQAHNCDVEKENNTIDTDGDKSSQISETPDISTEETIEGSEVQDHDETISTTDLVNTEGSTQYESQELLAKELTTSNRVMDHEDTTSAADHVNTDVSTQHNTFDVDTENNIMNDTNETNDDNDVDGRRIGMNPINVELQAVEGEENVNAVEQENDEIINDGDKELVSETQEFLTKESATRNEAMDHDNLTTTEFVNTDASTQHTTLRNTFDVNIQNNDMNNHSNTNDDNNEDEAMVGIDPARIGLSEGEGDEDDQFVEREGDIAVEEENNEISIDTDDEYISETQDISMKEAVNRTVVYGVTSSTDNANTEVSSQQIILPNTLDMDTQFNTNTINNSDANNDENNDKEAMLIESPEDDGEEDTDGVEEEIDEICNNFDDEHISETIELSANKTAVVNGTLDHDDTRTIMAPTTNEIVHSIDDAIGPKMGSDIPVMDIHSSLNDNVLNKNEVQKVNNDVPIDSDVNVDDDNDDDVVLETQQCINTRDDSDTLSYKNITTPFIQTQSLICEKENKQCGSNGTINDNDFVPAHNSQVKIIDTYAFATQRIEPLLSNRHPGQVDGDGDDDDDDVEFLETQLPLDMNVRKEIGEIRETQRLLSDVEQYMGKDPHGGSNEVTDNGNEVNNKILSGKDTTDSTPVAVEDLNDKSVNDFFDIQTTHEKNQEKKSLDHSIQTDTDQQGTLVDTITNPDGATNEIVLETQDHNDGTYIESKNTNVSKMLTSESNKRQLQNQSCDIGVCMDRIDSTADSTIPKNMEAKDTVTNDDKSTVDPMPIVDTRTKKRRKKEFQFGGDVFRSLIFDRR